MNDIRFLLRLIKEIDKDKSTLTDLFFIQSFRNIYAQQKDLPLNILSLNQPESLIFNTTAALISLIFLLVKFKSKTKKWL